MLEHFGFCFMKKFRCRDALIPLEVACKINPRSPAAVYLLGDCHDSPRNREQAMNLYRSCLSLTDNDQKRLHAARNDPVQGRYCGIPGFVVGRQFPNEYGTYYGSAGVAAAAILGSSALLLVFYAVFQQLLSRDYNPHS
jgi:hypothetical protein